MRPPARQHRPVAGRASPARRPARSVISSEGGFTATDTYGGTPTSPGGSLAHLGSPLGEDEGDGTEGA
jgi:hypothetical protein